MDVPVGGSGDAPDSSFYPYASIPTPVVLMQNRHFRYLRVSNFDMPTLAHTAASSCKGRYQDSTLTLSRVDIPYRA